MGYYEKNKEYGANCKRYISKNHEYAKGNDFENNCNCREPEEGKVRRYEKEFDVKGNNYCVENKNYYDNYYNRYNNYYVTDYDYVNNYYADYNVYHYKRELIDENSQYLGCKDIYANEANANNNGANYNGFENGGHHRPNGNNGGSRPNYGFENEECRPNHGGCRPEYEDKYECQCECNKKHYR